ncbi:MAG TPA: hypothetical protein VFB29_09340 [Pseudolabrys sp.]|nr:hypothetical protein [Pseudolabrys sp.]
MTAPRPASKLDRAFFALVTRGWEARAIADYESTLRKRDKAISAEAARTFASIDAKATGLLTHTSMMIAGLGLIAPLVADSRLEVGIVVAEMAIYLLIALGCLRCLSVFRAHEFDIDDHVQAVIHRELIIRAELYSLCIRAAIVFTIVVFVLLPLLYFWTSEKPA